MTKLKARVTRKLKGGPWIGRVKLPSGFTQAGFAYDYAHVYVNRASVRITLRNSTWVPSTPAVTTSFSRGAFDQRDEKSILDYYLDVFAAADPDSLERFTFSKDPIDVLF